MKTLLSTSILAAMLALTGCAPTTVTSANDAYVADSVVTANVKSALALQPGLNPAEIYVETYQGNVQLGGFVSSQQEIDTALAAARSVAGVKLVTNDMRLK
ncbi:BON domain-containing protein [Pseudoduganella ginsengisoli]|uniref:BON domain-containing protein n=1 Tax=Pseudoduganella ginsengisoli TaxID=1462440 RepID=A0A6L6Q0X1_9BURK|nr:BON domain-containing protein [Pseudoduganella ginsengisoli]MTW03280.1 BON domain-containing protein [Pseudoduganella ginsengisoli]